MFIPRLRLALSGASPFLVHVFLVVSVVLYIVFGAVMMQFFESSANDTDTSPEVYPTKPITYKMEPIATWETAALTQDLTGSDLASEDPNVHICIQRVLESLMNSTKCLEHEVDLYILNPIDECYQNAVFVVEQKQKEIKNVKQFGKKGRLMKDSEDVEIIEEQWTFTNAVIFAFTVITTIGYGHIAPVTFEGRLFCIVYGLIGVPFTLLTIADIGMFLSRLLRLIVKAITFIINWAKSIRREGLFNMVLRRKVSRIWLTEVPIESPTKEPLQTESQNDEEERDNGESIGLSITFVIYLLVGAYLLSLYEPEMDYFKAFYFNFVTLTTIGLGDFVPRSNNYIFLTLIYITVGLALTTLAIEIAAEYLKKLHYFGRKIEDVAGAEVWFGGKKMTLKNLIHHLGDQFNIPADELDNLNLDNFVDAAIKVEDGEIKTLRKPETNQHVLYENEKPISYRRLRKTDDASTIGFADERSMANTFRYDAPPLATAETSRTLPTVREDGIKWKPGRFFDKDTMTIGSGDETSIEEELIREVSMEPMPEFLKYM